jgi:hypothetical protein
MDGKILPASNFLFKWDILIFFFIPQTIALPARHENTQRFLNGMFVRIGMPPNP